MCMRYFPTINHKVCLLRFSFTRIEQATTKTKKVAAKNVSPKEGTGAGETLVQWGLPTCFPFPHTASGTAFARIGSNRIKMRISNFITNSTYIFMFKNTEIKR